MNYNRYPRVNKYQQRQNFNPWPYQSQSPYYQQQPYYLMQQPPIPVGYQQQGTMQPTQNAPFPTPYPTNAFPQQQQSGFNSVLAQFKTEDGTYDVNKMMDTAGQMMGAVNQVSGIVKGFSGIFKA